MNLAATLRYCSFNKTSIWDHRYYIMGAYTLMAQRYGIGMHAVMTEFDFERVCEQCDGLFIPGSGTNIDPTYYGGQPFDPPEPVDEYALDAKLIQFFLDRNRPIFGICGGLQAINVFLGGTLKRVPDSKNHSTSIKVTNRNDVELDYKNHVIKIAKDSFVYDVFGAEKATVNSYHGWCIDKLAPGLSIAAQTEDGVIEAIEWKEKKIFATQWHPELSFEVINPVEHKFFENFIACCKDAEK